MIKTLHTVFTQKTHDGTTERLLQYSFAYFGLYVIVGFLAKYFRDVLGMAGTSYAVYNTIGGLLLCNVVVIAWGWYKFKSSDRINFLGINMPREFLYIIPSGVCTAVIIPTTTLMYTLPISVMVAMIIMRASVIIISRVVDAIQIKQGILHKIVYWEENVAVVVALCAVALQMLNFKGATAMVQSTGNYAIFPLLNQLFIFDKANFNFLGNAAAMTILTFYLIAYSIRIYIFNYYKNTRKPDAVYDTKGFFAVEQISSTTAIIIAGLVYFYVSDPVFNAALPAAKQTFAFQFKDAFLNVPDRWLEAIISGLPFGLAAFFSVFLFMFKGRTATFAGLVNRLASLVAGTTATLFVWWLIAGQKPPKPEDWLGLAAIFVAIYFVGKAEKKRACELAKTHEIEPEKDSEVVCDPANGAAAAKARN